MHVPAVGRADLTRGRILPFFRYFRHFFHRELP